MNSLAGPQPFALAAHSAASTSLKRSTRSKGLWLLLLGGLIGARFWLPRGDGTSFILSINNHLPELTSPMIGLSLGTVLSTLLLPLCFLYLRSNVTRQQPWQIAEVSPASRVAISLGSFFADSTVLCMLLSVMALAGWVMAWFVLPVAQVHLWQIALTLGLTGVPALLGIAAFRQSVEAAAASCLVWLHLGPPGDRRMRNSDRSRSHGHGSTGFALDVPPPDVTRCHGRTR